jgi:hypothetical protein
MASFPSTSKTRFELSPGFIAKAVVIRSWAAPRPGDGGGEPVGNFAVHLRSALGGDQFSCQGFANIFERRERRGPVLFDADHMESEVAPDGITHDTRFEGEGGVLERLHHLPAAERAEVPAGVLGARIVADFAGDRREVLPTRDPFDHRSCASLGDGHRRFVRIGRQGDQDVAGVHLLRSVVDLRTLMVEGADLFLAGREEGGDLLRRDLRGIPRRAVVQHDECDPDLLEALAQRIAGFPFGNPGVPVQDARHLGRQHAQALVPHEVPLVAVLVLDEAIEALAVETAVRAAEERRAHDQLLDLPLGHQQPELLGLLGQNRALDQHPRGELVEGVFERGSIELVAQGFLILFEPAGSFRLELPDSEAIGPNLHDGTRRRPLAPHPGNEEEDEHAAEGEDEQTCQPALAFPD